MTDWIDRIEDQHENMEDPNCSTRPQALFCPQCHGYVRPDFAHDQYEMDFCCEGCAEEFWQYNYLFFRVHWMHKNVAYGIEIPALNKEHAIARVLLDQFNNDLDLVEFTDAFEVQRSH